MLGRVQLIRYLLGRKLISARSIVEGDLTIVDASRRNHNFAVLRKNGPSYLLKQGIDPERAASIANEARVYQLFNSDARSGEFARRHLPGYVDYDPNERILVLEFLSNARNLQEHCTRCGRFSCGIAALLGNALSSFHRNGSRSRMDDGGTPVHKQPWILSLHRPGVPVISSISEANIQLIKILQQYSEFSNLLDELSREWRLETLIHSDIKWENTLVLISKGRAALKLIDWELAGVGDPMWDVGSVFSSYINFWLQFTPVAAESRPDEFLQHARYQLKTMHPALRSFWRSYEQNMNADRLTTELLMMRAIRYSAARLVQMCFEQMHLSPRLIGNVICSLQLSLNMLKRPKEAATVLLGLPLNCA